MKLKEICENITDGSHNPPSGIDSSEYLMLSSKNIFDDKITLEEPRYLSEEQFLAEDKRTCIKAGDVLMTIVGTVGRAAVVTADIPKITLQRSVAVLHPHCDVCNSRFLMYLLRSKKNFFEQEAHGVAQKGIYLKQLSEISVSIPAISQQEDVVGKLDRINKIIKSRQLELDKLDELIKARFVEVFDKCSEEVLIGDVISICRGASPRPIQSFITDDPDGVNWIKIGDVSENSIYITQTAERITKEGAKKSRTVHRGDFILSNSMSFGRPYILGIEGCVHDGWLILSDFRDTFDELYLYHALRSEHVQHQFSGKVNGATVKNLNSDLVKETYIKVPEMKEQEAFADFVKQVDKSKVVVQKALDEAQLLFDSLMQEYFG